MRLVHAKPSRLLCQEARSVWSEPSARRVVSSCRSFVARDVGFAKSQTRVSADTRRRDVARASRRRASQACQFKEGTSDVSVSVERLGRGARGAERRARTASREGIRACTYRIVHDGQRGYQVRGRGEEPRRERHVLHATHCAFRSVSPTRFFRSSDEANGPSSDLGVELSAGAGAWRAGRAGRGRARGAGSSAASDGVAGSSAGVAVLKETTSTTDRAHGLIGLAKSTENGNGKLGAELSRF